MTMFARTRVTVLDDATGHPLRLCAGPRPDGSCSALGGAAHRCRGCAIVAELAGDRRRVRLFVPALLDRCPLAPVPSSEAPAQLRAVAVGHPWAG